MKYEENSQIRLGEIDLLSHSLAKTICSLVDAYDPVKSHSEELGRFTHYRNLVYKHIIDQCHIDHIGISIWNDETNQPYVWSKSDEPGN